MFQRSLLSNLFSVYSVKNFRWKVILILLLSKFLSLCEHITLVLCKLHWLPIEEHIVFKILLMTFKCMMGLAPSYLSDLVERYVRRNLCSMNGYRLVEVKHNLRKYGFRSFSVAAQQLWNALPSNIRACDNISEFKRKLKNIF